MSKTIRLLAILFAQIVILVGGARVSAQDSSAKSVETLAVLMAVEIKTKELEFPVKCSDGLIHGKQADAEAITRYAKLFVSEFSVYPPELIRAARLKRIVFCRDLDYDGQLRTAIPDFEHDTLYLDVCRAAEKTTYLRKVLHHEFYHLIDYRDDGLVYQDERWATLNSAPFRYGDGGRNAQNKSDTSTLTKAFPGFLNHYSTTGVEEDKAEVFANLIVSRPEVDARLRDDPVFARKVALMKSMMVTFCPQIDEVFWTKAAGQSRTAD